MRTNRVRGTVLSALAITCLTIAPAMAAGKPSTPPAVTPPVVMDKSEVEVQILAINDFRGYLEPPAGSSGRVADIVDGVPVTVDAGGAEYLASHVKALEAENRNTVVVSAGDLIGASPLISALFMTSPRSRR